NGGAVFEVEINLPPQQAAPRVDVVDDHLRDVGIGDADERQRAGLVRDHAYLDGLFPHGLLPYVPRPNGPDHAWRMPAGFRRGMGWIPYARRPGSRAKSAAPARVVTPIFE